MKSLRLVAFALCAFSASAPGWARLVHPPSTMVVASPDGGSLLRIDPANWTSVDPAQHATASVFRYDPASKSYQLGATFALRNQVAPDLAAISTDATYIVTCDDWDRIGCTPNTVVIYRGSGEFLKAWSLTDIFSPEEIDRLSPKFSNTASRYWRGNFLQIIGSTLSIPPRLEAPWQVGSLLNLGTLKFSRIGEHWVDPKTQKAIPTPKVPLRATH